MDFGRSLEAELFNYGKKEAHRELTDIRWRTQVGAEGKRFGMSKILEDIEGLKKKNAGLLAARHKVAKRLFEGLVIIGGQVHGCDSAPSNGKA